MTQDNLQKALMVEQLYNDGLITKVEAKRLLTILFPTAFKPKNTKLGKILYK